MGQRVQMHVKTLKDGKPFYKTFHQQWCLGNEFSELFQCKDCNSQKEIDKLSKKLYSKKDSTANLCHNFLKMIMEKQKHFIASKKPSYENESKMLIPGSSIPIESPMFAKGLPVFAGDNNNGYLIIDDIAKKYAFIIGEEEDTNNTINKDAAEIPALSIDEFLKLFEKMKGSNYSVKTPVLKQLEHNYQLMTNKELNEFIFDQAKTIDEYWKTIDEQPDAVKNLQELFPKNHYFKNQTKKLTH